MQCKYEYPNLVPCMLNLSSGLHGLDSEAMPDRDEVQDCNTVRQNLLLVFPPVNIQPLVLSDEINYFSLRRGDFDSDADLAPLVASRKAHETHFAKKSVRIGTLKPEVSITTVTDDSVDNNPRITTTSARSMLIKKIHSTLRSVSEQAVSTTGASRRSRHEGKFETTQGGNSANATAAAKLRGASVCIFLRILTNYLTHLSLITRRSKPDKKHTPSRS
jgi:hypothetical protein